MSFTATCPKCGTKHTVPANAPRGARAKVPLFVWLLVAAVAAVVIYGAGWSVVMHLLDGLHIAFAQDQTAIFEEMRAKAIRAATPEEAVGYLEYATCCYPSGTKQVQGSRLDEIVESAHRSAIREIIAHLHKQTGEDLGNDPEVWIGRSRKRP